MATPKPVYTGVPRFSPDPPRGWDMTQLSFDVNPPVFSGVCDE